MTANDPGEHDPVLMENWEIRSTARARLAGKWGKGALAIIIQILVAAAVEGIFTPSHAFLAAVVSIGVQMPLTYGIAAFFLKIVRGQDPNYGEIFDGFRIFCKSIGVQFIPGLIALFWSLAVMAAGAIVVGLAMLAGISGGRPVGFGYGDYALLVFSRIGIPVIVVTAVVGAAITLRYILTAYILYDHKDWDVMTVVRRSATMMRGFRFKFLLLQLSFIGWALLSILTLGIGMLFLLPYVMTSSAVFYEDLNGALTEPG